MSKCTNPEAGDLLHAYELNALSEEDTERFEIHLLECEYCFEQLKNFEREANLLVSDQEIKGLIRKSVVDESQESESFLKKLWRYIWPETPLFLRPALAYILILLLIIPAYWGLRKSTEKEIRPINQTISLTPFRSAEENALRASVGGDALIDFLFEDAVVGQSYRLTIESEDGRVIFQDDAFNAFDGHRHGRITLPPAKMKPGDYRLTITDPRAEPPLNKGEYTFRIER